MKFAHKLSAVAGFAMAAAAYAQPASFTDLGDRSSSQVFTQTVTLIAANDVQWYKVVLPAVSSTDGWVDIYTNTPGTMTDSEIGLYDASGNIVNGLAGGSDDDSGNGLFSQLTYGQTSPTRAAIGTGNVRDGVDGVLAGGTYWLAVSHFSTAHVATGWGVTSTYTGTGRTIDLTFDIAAPGSPIPPSGIGSYTPNSGGPSDVTVAAVTVTPGANPVSSGLAVSLDASLLGAGTVSLLDDGVSPDVTAGDNIFTANVTVGTVPGGLKNTPFTVSDAEGRSTNGTMGFTVVLPPQWDENTNGGGDAGDALATAQTPTGTDPFVSIGGTFNTDDVDIYKIRICGGGAFNITTNTTPTGTQDTQLFMFDTNGAGVVMNDDQVGGAAGLRSTIDSTVAVPDGTYYLAVTRYDRDPLNAGGFPIWEDQPFQSVRAPDGLTNGGDITLASWTGTFTATNIGYELAMSGVCFATNVCVADYNGDTVVDFFDYLDFVADFSSNAPGADFNADTVIDFFDYLDFVAAFSVGC